MEFLATTFSCSICGNHRLGLLHNKFLENLSTIDTEGHQNRGQAKPLRPRHDNYEPRHEKNRSALNPSRTLSTEFYVLWAKSAPLCITSRSAVPPLGVNSISTELERRTYSSLQLTVTDDRQFGRIFVASTWRTLPAYLAACCEALSSVVSRQPEHIKEFDLSFPRASVHQRPHSLHLHREDKHHRQYRRKDPTAVF